MGMTNRRQFLGTLSAAAAAAALPGALRAMSRRERLDRCGVQRYTVRAEMAKSVENTLEAVAKAGYREVEFAGYFGRQPAALRAQLDSLRLTAPSVHVGIDVLESDWAVQVASAKVIGHKTLIVPSVDRRKLPAVTDWKALAARFNALGKKAAAEGLRIGYHNHNFEFPPLEGGPRPFDVLVGETDPTLVDFEMDLYWITFAGADPLAYFARYPGRFKFVHVKDGGPRPEFEMRDVGAGTIDWKAIFQRRKLAGIEHVFVEHDQPKDPLASIQASARYLQQLEF
jgi:sugar phosphate isomerase/epimerase